MISHEILLMLLGILLLSGILSGIPVAFVLLGVPLLVATAASMLGLFDMAFIAAFPSRVFGLLTNPIMISVPLFVLMGNLLEYSDIAKRMMLTAGALFGQRRGGMAYAVIIVGALLAASTGVIAATIFMLGVIALPAMIKGNYSNRLSAGVICASGSLGQIIPPSILLILLADQISSAYQAGRRQAGDWAADPVSVGDIFAGAMLPGLLLVVLYIVYIFIMAKVKPETCPPVDLQQIEGIGDKLGVTDVVSALLAPLLLIFLVLGSILGGITTPSESAALGAIGALLMVSYNRAEKGAWLRKLFALSGLAVLVLLAAKATASLETDGGTLLAQIVSMAAFAVLIIAVLIAVYLEYRKGDLFEVSRATAGMVASILLIVLGAFMLSLVFRGLGGEEIVSELLTTLPGGSFTALLAVMAVIFFLGFILEYVEIIFIVVPIAGPPLMASGIDPVWLAVLISMNLQMSFLTPPFGYALFYLKSVAPPSLKTQDIYISIIPFVLIQFVALGLVAYFPSIATYLPSVIYK